MGMDRQSSLSSFAVVENHVYNQKSNSKPWIRSIAIGTEQWILTCWQLPLIHDAMLVWGRSQITKSRLSPVLFQALFIPRAYRCSPGIRLLKYGTANQLPFIRTGASQLAKPTTGLRTCPFTVGHRALPLRRQLVNLRWQPLGAVFGAFRHSPPWRGRAGDICCQHAVQESKDWP